MIARDVLISGAGPAGLALATLLARADHHVTVVERAPVMRTGGYAVDLRGDALDVAAELGVLGRLRDLSTDMRPTLVLDADGEVVEELPVERFSGDLEIAKPDLVAALADSLPDSVRLVLGDSLGALSPHATGVEARFERAGRSSYDVVVGADGVRSRTRQLAFGPHERFVRDLGLAGVGFTTDNWLGLDHQGLLRPGRGRAAYVVSTGDARRMTVSLTCAAGSGLSAGEPSDQATLTRLVRRAFADDGWEIPRLLAAMERATDLYGAAGQQVVMPRWTTGRITLLGDAACCAAPTSGMGTTQALVGARSLAGALAADDLDLALADHEAALRPWVEDNQAQGRAAAADLGALPAG